jgi:rhamnulokinase
MLVVKLCANLRKPAGTKELTITGVTVGAVVHELVPQNPHTKGEVIRVALESIAWKYRWILERLEELTVKKFAPIYIVGGGAKNRLLSQLTASAATTIGNVLMQAIGLKRLGSLSDVRAVVRASEVEEYHPVHGSGWDEAYAKLLSSLDSNIS